MYITLNDQTYPDVTRKRLTNGDVLFSGVSVESVSGEIVTYRNDGFELARDNPQDYLRSVIGSQSVLLSNNPTPQPQRTMWDEMADAIREGVNEL